MKTLRLKSVIIIIISIPFMLFTCFTKDEVQHRLLIVNNLNSDIYCIPSFEFPDTTLNFTSKQVLLANDIAYTVGAHFSERIDYLSLCYKNEWTMLVPKDTLILFVLDKNVVNNNDWDYIKKNNKILRKYFLRYADISSTCSWTVK